LTCVANKCKPTGNVTNSNKVDVGSITGKTGDIVAVTCDAGYLGTGTTECQTDGDFSSVPTCVECETGKYSETPGQSSCKDDCDAGSSWLQFYLFQFPLIVKLVL